MGGKRAKHIKRLKAQSATALVGVDAGKFHHALVVRPCGKNDSKPLKFAATRKGFDDALAFIQKTTDNAPPSEVIVGIEFAGNCGFTLAHFLDQHGFAVVSILPLHTKKWKEVQHGSPLKTDEKDAQTIVDLLSSGHFVGFPFLRPAHAELRQLVSAHHRLTLQRSGTALRLRSVLHVCWPEFEREFTTFTTNHTVLAVLEAFPNPRALLATSREAVVELLRRVSRGQRGAALAKRLFEIAEESLALPNSQDASHGEIPLLAAQIRLYSAQLKAIEAQMERALDSLPETEALLSVPLVSTVTAAVFVGSIGDARAYETAEQVLKIAGLNLVETSSGLKRGSKRISKRGRSVLRRSLFLLATRHIRKDGLYRAQYDQLVARGHHDLAARTALARMLLRALYAVARDRKPYDPAKSGAHARPASQEATD